MSHQTVSSLKDQNASRSPLWYNGAVEDSDPEDAPSHLDLLAAASTPLRVSPGKNSLFSSPTKRLDNLRLSPRKGTPVNSLRQFNSAFGSSSNFGSHSSLGSNSEPISIFHDRPNTSAANRDKRIGNIIEEIDAEAEAEADVSGFINDSIRSEFIHNEIEDQNNSRSNGNGKVMSIAEFDGHEDNSNGVDDDLDDDEGLSPGGIADQTIVGESSSEEESSGSVFTQKILPMYIRKRKHLDSPMTRTPQHRHPLSQSSFTCDMSGIRTVESHNSTFSILKLSFSASDSTPCPPQPRKRLKFKLALSLTLFLPLSLSHMNLPQSIETPSQPSRVGKPILDISASRKLAASSVPLLTKLNNASASDHTSASASDDHSGDDRDCNDHDSDEPMENTEDSTRTGSSTQLSKFDVVSTPISQSTPANSRANSPAPYEYEESDIPNQEVNGFKFVRPITEPAYQTPVNRYPAAPTPKLQQLRNSYNSSDFSGSAYKYRIVGNVPVSAAGLMDESSEDVHIGDKRINDPYAGMAPNSMSSPLPGGRLSSAALLEKYHGTTDKLPLLEHFRRELEPEEMNQLINDGKSVWEFYKMILSSRLNDIHMMSFLKRERLRWHPDKWINKLEQSKFVGSNIENVSKVINLLIEEINNGFRESV